MSPKSSMCLGRLHNPRRREEPTEGWRRAAPLRNLFVPAARRPFTIIRQATSARVIQVCRVIPVVDGRLGGVPQLKDLNTSQHRYTLSSVSSRRPSEDHRRPSEDLATGRHSADTYGAGRASTEDNSYAASTTSRRLPSQDTTRRSEDRERDFCRSEDREHEYRRSEDRAEHNRHERHDHPQQEHHRGGGAGSSDRDCGGLRGGLQRELDELWETRQQEKNREARRAQDDKEEMRVLRYRCERLEAELESEQAGGADSETVDQLRTDMEGLLTELGDLSRRNDELMTAKDADLVVIRDLDNQLNDYKRKYEQAKTELRSVKATSQLFLQAPKMDRPEDQLPVSSDGGVLDIHVMAFLSAIDSLLTAGRSNAPTRVLTAMKAVVNAVSAIVHDVRAFKARPSREQSDVDLDALSGLRERAEATLTNLVAATKTHATSAGMLPVSLLNAAASHVAVTVTEIGRTICIRKASRAEQEQASISAYTPVSATNGFAPSLRSVDEGGGKTTPPRWRQWGTSARRVLRCRRVLRAAPPSKHGGNATIGHYGKTQRTALPPVLLGPAAERRSRRGGAYLGSWWWYKTNNNIAIVTKSQGLLVHASVQYDTQDL
ncbi:hypothetical protein DFH09DRAFT_1080640 [Mycena vulgaris]|nr:hypothetical protein DFH09DRAFT_1080640 [Mycena vulgaris]